MPKPPIDPAVLEVRQAELRWKTDFVNTRYRELLVEKAEQIASADGSK